MKKAGNTKGGSFLAVVFIGALVATPYGAVAKGGQGGPGGQSVHHGGGQHQGGNRGGQHHHGGQHNGAPLWLKILVPPLFLGVPVVHGPRIVVSGPSYFVEPQPMVVPVPVVVSAPPVGNSPLYGQPYSALPPPTTQQGAVRTVSPRRIDPSLWGAIETREERVTKEVACPDTLTSGSIARVCNAHSGQFRFADAPTETYWHQQECWICQNDPREGSIRWKER